MTKTLPSRFTDRMSDSDALIWNIESDPALRSTILCAALLSGAMMKAIDFTTSNVPGPRFPIYVSGAKVEHMFGFGPLAGAAANITCFSYDGELGLGINVDPAAVTDTKLFAECMRKGFDEVLAVV